VCVMSLRLKKIVAALFVISCVASSCVAQTQNAVVKRNTYLRQGPSTSDKKIILLKSDDELELLEPNATNSYYHVRTLDAEEGYAYSKNITVQENPQSLTTDLASPSGGRWLTRSCHHGISLTRRKRRSVVLTETAPGAAMTAIPTPSHARTGATPQKMTALTITM